MTTDTSTEPALEFELEAIGYGPATLSNDVTDRTGIHPGDELTARINATGAALADELKRQGYELTPAELDSMRAEAADCFAPASLADVAKLIGDSAGLLRSSSDSRTASPEELEERFEAIGAAVFDSIAETLGAGRNTAEDLDPGDPEDSEIFSRRARLELGRRDCSPDVRELADEFAENGLGDLADYLRANGLAATRRWLDETAIPQAREEDRELHRGEGFELGNLEVARETLEGFGA